MTAPRTRARVLALAAMAALLLLVPATVAAHAELDVPTPKDGATVEGTPNEVFGTFTQRINPDGSSLVLRDSADKVIARGGPDPDDDTRMVIADLPELAPGAYEVQWTTVSAEDSELARGTWSFTVTAPIPTKALPTPSPSASAAATPSATPAPTVAPSPSASSAPTDPTSTAGSDAILPIIAALAVVLIVTGYLLSRRGRPSDGV